MVMRGKPTYSFQYVLWLVLASGEMTTMKSRTAVEQVDSSAWKECLMRRYFSIALSMLALAVASPLLGACHTTAGVGEDVSAAGHAVTGEAKKLTP